mmetsp:Transcript_33580/g.49135  ORF Transcript_33580/g.49135 Transcript_33580/m.49135 type:complete len:393 (+) Transcript_33580:41-1219(+)
MVVRGGGWIATSQSQSQDLFEDDQFPNTDRRSDAPGPCSGKGKRKARPQSDVSYDLEEKEQSQTPSVVVAASQSQQEDTPLAPLPPPESSSQMPVMEPPEERQKKWFQEFAAVNYGECRMILDPRERETRCLRPAAYLWYHNAKGKKVLLPVCLGCARRLSVTLQPATVEYAGTRRKKAWDVRPVQAVLSKEDEGKSKSKEGQQAWPQCRGDGGQCRHAAIYGRSESGDKKVIPYACYLHKSDHHVVYQHFATKNGMQCHDSKQREAAAGKQPASTRAKQCTFHGCKSPIVVMELQFEEDGTTVKQPPKNGRYRAGHRPPEKRCRLHVPGFGQWEDSPSTVWVDHKPNVRCSNWELGCPLRKATQNKASKSSKTQLCATALCEELAMTNQPP